MKVDLHLHTFHSDGLLTPLQVLDLASQHQLSILSFTDHNYFKNYLNSDLQKQAEKRGIKLLNGLEVSAQFRGKEIHLLGYGLEKICSELEDYFQSYTREKTEQTRLRCQESLRCPLFLNSGQPFSLSFEELLSYFKNKNFSEEKQIYFWNDMAYPLAEKFKQLKAPEAPLMGCYDSKGLLAGLPHSYEKFKSSFQNLEKNKRLWNIYHSVHHLPAGKVISLIQKNGGYSCLAHPGEQPDLGEETITELRQVGLDALEVYSPKNRGRLLLYQALAETLGLLISGGTDFHYSDSHNRLGMILENRAIESPLESDFFPILKEKVTFLSKLL